MSDAAPEVQITVDETDTMDPRLSDHVAAENVRKLLAEGLRDAPDAPRGTLAHEVAAWGLHRAAQGFQAGRRAGRDEVMAELHAAARVALAEAEKIIKGLK
jgi:hypothetical protein